MTKATHSRIPWETDTSPADWIGPRLHPFGQDTGSVVPEGFDAYCRIFHPFHSPWPDSEIITWTEVARRNDRVAHASMQFHEINRPIGSPVPDRFAWDQGLRWGECPDEVITPLVAILRTQTLTPDRCWFCVWEGYGSIKYPRVLRKVVHPARNYGLYGGPIENALISLDGVRSGSSPSPNLWWPDDQAWIVATEIDFAWTYVGGTDELIREIIESDQVEALAITLDASPMSNADVINAALDG